MQNKQKTKTKQMKKQQNSDNQDSLNKKGWTDCRGENRKDFYDVIGFKHLSILVTTSLTFPWRSTWI